MGHLVEQSEVTAIETQVSKVTSTTVTSSASHQAELHHLTAQGQQGQDEGNRRQQQQQQQQQEQQKQQQQHQQQAAAAVVGVVAGNQGRKPEHLNTEEAGGDKREKSEDDGLEEEENGWWAERVVGALGGLGGDYGDTWYRSHAHLLHGDGPLPHTWRLYIAALAVCRHEVGWLMHALLTDFRNAGGDIRWMAGVHLAPPKLYALVSINNLLAHRPWLLLPQHIQQLTKGEESWSLGELCQALCIMTHFHALSSFLHGSGLSTVPGRSKKEGGAMNREAGNSSKGTAGCLQNQKGCPESNANANCSLKTRTDIKNTVPAVGVQHRVRTYAHLTLNPTLMYEDFNGNDESCIPSFSVHEYNWQDHGYAMCSRLLGEVGAFLDERFTSALSATHTLPQKQLSGKATVNQQPGNMSESTHCDKAPAKTMPIPTKALWNYVQWLLGIQHDDCDYALLNKHLDPQVKAFVKAACCYPETLEDAGSRPAANSGIVPSLVETSVVVMEARLQSELLYALRAIMLHQC